MWIRIQCGPRIRVLFRNPDPDPGGQKWPPKNREKLINFMFWSAGFSLLRAEGFSCVLKVLYGSLGIAIFDQKKKKKFWCIFFSYIFCHQNPGSGSGFTWNAGSGFNEYGSTTLKQFFVRPDQLEVIKGLAIPWCSGCGHQEMLQVHKIFPKYVLIYLLQIPVAHTVLFAVLGSRKSKLRLRLQLLHEHMSYFPFFLKNFFKFLIKYQ